VTKELKQHFEEFMYECKYLKNNSPKTQLNMQNAFELFVKLTDAKYPEDISSNSIMRFIQILQERKRMVGKGIIKIGVKASTIVTYWRKLNVFFNWLVKLKYITTNPLSEIKPPALSYEDKKFLSKESVEKIVSSLYLHNTENSLIYKRNILIFHLLLFCGLRRGELLGLHVSDIDIESRLLKVRGETSKSRRTRLIPLHPTIIAHLRDYLRIREAYKTPFLLVSRINDDGLSSDGFKHLIQDVQDRSGVKFHVHQLRHTFAVNFLKSSNNLAKLQQLLGHKSIMMTTVYLRCLPPSEMTKDIDSMYIDNFI